MEGHRGGHTQGLIFLTIRRLHRVIGIRLRGGSLGAGCIESVEESDDQAGDERSERLPPMPPPVADNEFLSTLGLGSGLGLGLAGPGGEVGRGARSSSSLLLYRNS